MTTLLAALALAAGAQSTEGPIVAPAPAGMPHNDDFTVRVRRPGGPWLDVFEHEVTVDLDAPQKASMAMFDMTGPVEVEVHRNNGDVRRVTVRPERAGVTATLDGATARFTLRHPAKLSVEFDGDRLHNLHLFAGSREGDTPSCAAPGVQCFGPGVHLPPDRPGTVFSFPSHTTVVLAPGAVLRGKIVLDRVSDVRIVGRGIIDHPERGFEITRSSRITIDGPTIVNPQHYTVYCGQSEGVRIHDLKTFSAAPWSDGLDMMSCSDVKVEDVFLRTSDDAIAIYGGRWGFRGDAKRISVRDAVLWADVAHPINIGLHGGGDRDPQTIEDVSFGKIDVLGHDEDDPEYQGVIAISDGDANLVRRIAFDDVAVEDVQEGALINLRVVFNQKYSLAPGRGIEDVAIRDVRVTATGLRPSRIAGYDENRGVRGVSITGLVINGRRIADAAAADIVIGDHVRDVRIAR